MSKVYVRSSRNAMSQDLSEVGTRPKQKSAAIDQPPLDQATCQDNLVAEHLHRSSGEASDNDTINSPKDHQELGDNFEGVRNSSVPIQSSRTDLFQACEQGDIFWVKSLLVCELDLYARSTEAKYAGFTIIHVAAMHGHVNVVKTLLEHGASVEKETVVQTSGDPRSFEEWIESINGLRPLHLAARNRQGPMARFLIESRAEIAARAEYNVQPVHLAAACGSIEILDLLIGAGAAIDASCRRPGHHMTGWQPLHWAVAARYQRNIITYLLSKGADLEAQTSGGLDPLQVACLFDQVANVRTLLAHHDMNAHDGKRLIAFFYAMNAKASSTVEWLLNDGMDPNCRNAYGKTAIHVLSSSKIFESADVSDTLSSTERIFQSLLTHGANVDAVNRSGNQALHLLANRGRLVTHELEMETKLAQLLLVYGADIDAINDYGMTPLYLALGRGKSQLSIMLIKSGARMISDVNEKTTMVELPLDDEGDFTETEVTKLRELLVEHGLL